MSIQGTCSSCGFVFLLEYGTDCPQCSMTARAERVARAFAPVDILRTGIGLNSCGEYYRGNVEAYGTAVVDDKAFGIPKYEDDQVYQLKRMFRL